MKKLILISCLFLLEIAAHAQLPRYGTKPNQDNTGRIFTYGYTTLSGTALTVTGSNVNYNSTLIYVVSTGNTTISGKNMTTGKIGDNVRFIFSTASGTNIYTFLTSPTTATGFGFNYTGPITVAGTKNATINFMSNGNNRYVEQGRFVEP